MRSKVEAARQSWVKFSEEFARTTLNGKTATLAGNSNSNTTATREVQGPDMEVGSRVEAECLTFRTYVGGDTLDAFAPLSHYT